MSGEWIKAGEIGVDAGLCWIGDPCYVVSKDASHVFKSWSDFCDQIGSDDVKQFNYNHGHPGLGVAVQTGYGDGTYPVYIRRNKEGRVMEVKAVFDEE